MCCFLVAVVEVAHVRDGAEEEDARYSKHDTREVLVVGCGGGVGGGEARVNWGANRTAV